jgi:hypothetical protein
MKNSKDSSVPVLTTVNGETEVLLMSKDPSNPHKFIFTPVPDLKGEAAEKFVDDFRNKGNSSKNMGGSKQTIADIDVVPVLRESEGGSKSVIGVAKDPLNPKAMLFMEAPDFKKHEGQAAVDYINGFQQAGVNNTAFKEAKKACNADGKETLTPYCEGLSRGDAVSSINNSKKR